MVGDLITMGFTRKIPPFGIIVSIDFGKKIEKFSGIYLREYNTQIKCRLPNVDIYVVRISKEMTLNSKPCAHCLLNIKFLGIKRIFYTTGKDQWECHKHYEIENSHISYGRKYFKI